MSLKKKSSFFSTLTLRLTLWYTAFFGALGLAAFLFVYVSLGADLEGRTDEELIQTANEFETLYLSHGIRALSSEFRREAHSRGIRRVFFRLISPLGKTLCVSEMVPWRRLTPRRLKPPPGKKTFVFRTLSIPGRDGKVRFVFKRLPEGHIIQIGMTLKDNQLLMAKYRKTFCTALVILVICGGIVGWGMARRAMSGVRKVTRAASRVGKNDLGYRVLAGGEGQEIDDLANAFNEMLERIEGLIRELKEVSDNIAHDLRSPITRIRGIAETTLLGDTDMAGYREMAAVVIEESDRLVGMTSTLLEIARTDAGVAEFSVEPLDMRGIVHEAVDLFFPLAEDREISIESEMIAGSFRVKGDRAMIQRVLANLLDNAIKFTPSGGVVTVSMVAAGSQGRITISDTGCGIGEKDLPRVFDRFYRCDKSRSTPGSGLGLSLARSLVQAHGGDITVKSTPGKGSAFTVSLPIMPSDLQVFAQN